MKAALDNLDRTRVLVVDDDQDVRELLRGVLEKCGYQVEVAGHGMQGLRLAAGWQPDIALVDVGLHAPDGYQGARLLRSALGSAPLLVGITERGRPVDRPRLLEAGFNLQLPRSAVERLLLLLRAWA